MSGGRLPPWGHEDRPWPISVGDLDAWDFFNQHETMEVQQFIDRMNRRDPPGVAALIGQAFHAAVEDALLGIARGDIRDATFASFQGTTRDGHTVEFTTQPGPRSAKDEIDVEIPSYTVVEQDVDLTFRCPAGWIYLRGVIDGLAGLVTIDVKTTRKISLEKYQDSWQWRAYLASLGPRYTTFRYEVFQVNYNVDKATEQIEAGKVPFVRIVDHKPLTCHRYPAMMNDIKQQVASLADFLGAIRWEPPPKRQMATF